MPELPEVETVRRGLLELLGKRSRIESVAIRQRQLRYPVPRSITRLNGQRIRDITRRAKYLIWDCDGVFLLNHLGMTGSWRLLADGEAPGKHDHCILSINKQRRLVYRDPRRFGMLDLCTDAVFNHERLCRLGPEPLDTEHFHVDYLHQICKTRKAAIKQVIMDQAVVVGVGNIYASESLFRAGIRPGNAAKSVSKKRLTALVDAIRAILGAAIEAGGSTISDFKQAGGSDGYFQHQFKVYERADAPCVQCGKAIKHGVHGQRSTYWCATCQR